MERGAGRAPGRRELLADVKAGWTLLLRPAPRYLGPRETGIDRALATTP
jgi:hypothetical protein